MLAAGPLVDPDSAPGLTELLPEMALLGTTGDPSRQSDPSRRALLLGARLDPLHGDAGLIGWRLTGPASRVGAMLDLLADLATRPSFPPTRLQLALGLAEERAAVEDPAGTRTATAVVIGAALGLDRPVAARAPATPWSRPTRAEVLRHWRKVVRPDRALLIVRVPGPARAKPGIARFAAWESRGVAAQPTKTCRSASVSSHVVVIDRPSSSELVLAAAVALPARGEPGRLEAEVAVEALGVRPLGRLARQVEQGQRPPVAPRIIDLGPASVLFIPIVGEPRQALERLWRLLQVLEALAESPPRGDELAIAIRQLAGRRARAADEPSERLASLARRYLRGPDRPAQQVTEASLAKHARRLFERRRVAVVGTGDPRLARVLDQLGGVTLWAPDGSVVGGRQPRPCGK